MTVAIAVLCALHFTAMFAVGLSAADDPQGFAIGSLWNVPDAPGSPLLSRFGGLQVARVWADGEWWRILTATFAHGSWMHLVLNLYALLAIGPWVERVLGKYWFLVQYILACVAGSLASLAWIEAAMVVGASGGILGLAGLLWVLRRFGAEATRAQLAEVSASALAITIVLVVALGAAVPIIAQAGHLGGLAAGFVGGWAFLGRPWRHVLSIVLLGALGLAAWRPTWSSQYHAFLGYHWLRAGEHATALASLESALERDPEDVELANAVAYELAIAGIELERARTLIERSLAAEPENPDYLDTMGWILCRKGETEAGLEWIRRAVAALDGESVAEIEAHLETCKDARVGSTP